jgi:hypothetical protein
MLPILLFQLTILCEKIVAAQHYADVGKQLLFTKNRNRVRRAVLGLSQDGACNDLLENLSVNGLTGDLSNAATFKPPLFSLVNTFTRNCRCSLVMTVMQLHCHGPGRLQLLIV